MGATLGAGTLWAALQQGKYHDENGAPKLRALLTTAIEVCEGMAYMHSHRIVHRDLTSGNILLMHEPVAQCAKAKVMLVIDWHHSLAELVLQGLTAFLV